VLIGSFENRSFDLRNLNATCLEVAWNQAEATLQSPRLDYVLYYRGLMTPPVHRMTIAHTDGHQVTIAAERYRADGMWIIFEDADRHEVYRLNERDVRSIRRDAA
jgi:hypothetical protein